jgi:hypothetical protein
MINFEMVKLWVELVEPVTNNITTVCKYSEMCNLPSQNSIANSEHLLTDSIAHFICVALVSSE